MMEEYVLLYAIIGILILSAGMNSCSEAENKRFIERESQCFEMTKSNDCFQALRGRK